ncbi:O-antigen ligase family protein [Patescibacteria group bacterium]|nr:O-antigen ligase family protein [Patescibacteria group bacterium]
MKKLFLAVDNKILKFLVGFLIVFIPVYPKLPSIGINHTWVYIRLEDFFIAFTVLIWFGQIVRKKTSLNLREGIPIFIYWFAGLCSLIISVIFIGPHLANFFPKVALLSYLRRIEYMILFFIAASTIRSIKDLRDYLIVLTIALTGVVIYGFGQRYYLYAWRLFPSFFEKFSFCFPSFQTGNEQFAKGIPLCLPSNARITSTFAGHYDLGVWLVLVIPILVSIAIVVRRFFIKAAIFLLSFFSVMLLIFTASRVSFIACLASVSSALFMGRKKRLILPWLITATVLLLVFNGSTARRLLETVRLTSIVTNSQGQVVGEAESALPASLRGKIAKSPVVVGNIPTQKLPKGSGFLSLPQISAPTATTTAVVQTSVPVEEAKKLKLANGGVEISTVSGSFLVQKALVYDISFTTRFQGEWPNAWKAFLRNPPLGSGFSSITLAADNDYLRALGESGFLGLFSFLSIFLLLGILLKESVNKIDSGIAKAYLIGLAGGMVGVFLNASLIDVFEASKFAETLWILLGIGTGVILLYNKEKINYLINLRRFFSSHILLISYLFVIVLVVLMPSINNFFTADDFTWLRWAASSDLFSIRQYFINAHGFFYRPLDKTLMFFLYTLFSFQPQGYHLFIIILHLLVGIGVYILGLKFFKRKFLAFLASVLFLLLPSSGENIFWLSTISTTLSTFFIIYSLIFMIFYRSKGSFLMYLLAVLFEIFALLSYEMALVYPVLLLILDLILLRPKRIKTVLVSYILPVFLVPLYLALRLSAHAVWPGGSYGYNLLHLVPNFVGNLLGYYALFILGEGSLSLYTIARSALRTHLTAVFLFLMIAVIMAVFLITVRRRDLKIILKNTGSSFAIFCFLFSVAALLPFLGLGNIAERYSYLTSIGFVFLAVFLLDAFVKRIIKQRRSLALYALLVIIIFWSLWNFSRLSAEGREWNHAGQITNKTLSIFRLYYSDIPKESSIYVANVPIKWENAWVFPLGLKDGLWFIYRNMPVNVYEVKDLAGLKASNTTYLFKFNKKGDLLKVE